MKFFGGMGHDTSNSQLVVIRIAIRKPCIQIMIQIQEKDSLFATAIPAGSQE